MPTVEEASAADTALPQGFHAATAEFQRQLIGRALAASDNNLQKTAALLEIEPPRAAPPDVKLGMREA